jgi:hypothetical protein
MSVAVVTAQWQGITGAPGYSNFTFGDGSPDPTAAADMVDAVYDFFDEVCNILGATTSIQVDPNVSWHNAATGVLEDITGVSPSPATLTGRFGTQGPGPTGGVVGWRTTGINRGRVVRGRTFIVPLASGCYEANGTLTSGTVTQLGEAATALVDHAPSTLGVWSRPRSGSGGAWFPVVTWRVPDMAAVLRSRRD